MDENIIGSPDPSALGAPDLQPPTSTDLESLTAPEPGVAPEPSVAQEAPDLELPELHELSNAERYGLDHLFGTVRGEVYFAALSGNTVVNKASVKAISFLETLFLKFAAGAEGILLHRRLKAVGFAD